MRFSNNQTTVSEGRNGCYTCTGVRADPHTPFRGVPQVVLSGLTSRDALARGDLTLPLADVPALIAELQQLLPPEGEAVGA